MNDVLISVIVPVYNVENYIKRCLDSIIGQSYTNLEIILVDDGSKDNSGKICDEYAALDSRIRTIHQPNAGLSAARNSGLDIAKGDYIFFVDSDDYIAFETIEMLKNEITAYDYDVVACGIELVWDEDREDRNSRFTNETPGSWDKRAAVWEMQFNNNICSVAWNKLYNAGLWQDIRFPVGKLHEDEYTTHKILYKAEKVAYIPDMLYKYYQRDTGINAGATRDDRDDHLNAFYERYLYFTDLNDRELAEWSLVKYLEYIKYLYRNAHSDERRKKLAAYYKKYYGLVRKYNFIEMRRKFAIILWNYWKY